MIYIVSDLHSNIERTQGLLEKARSKYGSEPGEGDILLVLGDLMDPLKTRMAKGSKMKANLKFLGWLSKQPFDVVTVRGNRESGKLLYRLRALEGTRYGGEVQKLVENVSVLSDGQVYELPVNEEEAISVLSLGGALSHSVRFKGMPLSAEVPYRQKYLHLKHAPEKLVVDLVASHDVPESKMGLLRPLFGSNVVNEDLDEVRERVEFSRWLFGHHHTDIRTAPDFRGIYKDILLVRKPEDVANL